MQTSGRDRDLVHVSTDSVAALARPTFVIRAHGKLYVTLAVWEYDAHAPHLTEEQRESIRELTDDFEREVHAGRTHQSVEWQDHEMIVSGGQTRPPGGSA